MLWVIVFVSFVVAVSLLGFALHYRITGQNKKQTDTFQEPSKGEELETSTPVVQSLDKTVSYCPLCKKELKKYENVFSKKYPKDSFSADMHVFGCPYCYSNHTFKKVPNEQLRKRSCPSCNKPLNNDDSYIIAEIFFDKKKNRVEAKGCLNCASKYY